jgi:hypothetical protein
MRSELHLFKASKCTSEEMSFILYLHCAFPCFILLEVTVYRWCSYFSPVLHMSKEARYPHED